MRDAEVAAAFERLEQSADAELTLAEHVTFVPQPVIRGREIVVEDAIPVNAAGIRFLK